MKSLTPSSNSQEHNGVNCEQQITLFFTARLEMDFSNFLFPRPLQKCHFLNRTCKQKVAARWFTNFCIEGSFGLVLFGAAELWLVIIEPSFCKQRFLIQNRLIVDSKDKDYSPNKGAAKIFSCDSSYII